MKKILLINIVLIILISFTSCKINLNIELPIKDIEIEQNDELNNFTDNNQSYNNLTVSQNYTTAYNKEKESDLGNNIVKDLPHPQGGPMLYPIYRYTSLTGFTGESTYQRRKTGFINEKGQIIIEPDNYLNYRYIYDDNGIIKYITISDQNDKYDIYTLDGQLYMSFDDFVYIAGSFDPYFYTQVFSFDYVTLSDINIYNINTKELIFEIESSENFSNINFLNNHIIAINYSDKPSVIYDLDDPTLTPINIGNAYNINGQIENGLFAASKNYIDFNSNVDIWRQDIVLGYINLQGEWIIEPQYYEASAFFNGVAIVKPEKNEMKFHIINEKNEIIHDISQYNYFYRIIVDNVVYYIADSDDLHYLFNENFEVIVTSPYWIGFDNDFAFTSPNYETYDNIILLEVPNRKPGSKSYLPYYEWIVSDIYCGYIGKDGNWLYREKFYQYLND